MDILHRDDLPLGGFAGLKEHQLVMDQKVFRKPGIRGSWEGIGNFVYLADAKFLPHGETRMHPHKEVDVISVMVEGRIAHEGSLEHGQELTTRGVQVQRAGGEGFSHNEINPDNVENRMIQLWVLPEVYGEPAGYKYYEPKDGKVTRIYGGKGDVEGVYKANTTIDIARLEEGESHFSEGDTLAYLIGGIAEIDGKPLKDGDLVRGQDLTFQANSDAHIILISTQ